MEFLAIVLAIVAIFISITKNSRLNELESKIQRLNKRVNYLSKTEDLEKETVVETLADQPTKKVTLKVEPNNLKVKIESFRDISTLNKFLENGTGIIGVLLLVMGMGFLGVYSAVNMTPFPRFILFVIYSLIIFAGSYFTEKKMNWLRLSLWLRSASGAIFLFACVGSAGIKGLIWVDNPLSGLLLISVGVIINILLGRLSQKEIISSSHLLLSLVALAIAPATLSTLFVGTVVTIYGISLTYRRRWDINLVSIITLFAAYHLYWNFRLTEGGVSLSNLDSLIALLMIFLTFLLALLSHYREIYSIKRFETLPFLTHFLNWCFLAIGIYMYRAIIPFGIAMFSGGSIISLFIAKKADKLNISWLKTTDTLVANLLMIFAVLGFYPRGVNILFISAILLVESVIFLTIVTIERDKVLGKIGYFITIFFSSLLFFFNFTVEADYKTPLLSLLLILLYVSYFFALKRDSLFKEIDTKFGNLATVWFPSLAFSILINSSINLLNPLLFMALITPVIFFRERVKNSILINTLKVMLPLSGLVIIFNGLDSYTFSNKLVYYLPYLLTLGLLLRFSYNDKKNSYFNFFATAQLQLSFIIISFIVLKPISIFLPGVLFLVVILSNIIGSNLLITKNINKKWLSNTQEHLIVNSYFILGVYFILHFVQLNSIEDTLFTIKTRYFMDLLVVGLMFYWISLKDLKVTFGGFILETALIFIALTTLVEVNSDFRPLVFILIATGSVFLKLKNRGSLNRLRFYSIPFSWIASSLLVTNSINSNRVLLPIITILVFTLYLVLIKRFGELDQITYPGYLKKVQSLAIKVNRKINLWVFYPFFMAVALSILFSADTNIMTLLFVLLSLIIFVLSIVLKEDNFKILSLIGLAGSLLRMILIDLSNSQTLTRALVFIGVGVVMVLMNMIYMRFSKES